MGTMKQTLTEMNEKLDMAGGNEEMKCDLKEMAKQLERISTQLQHGGGKNTKSKVIVAGGLNNEKRGKVLQSVEMFDLSKQAWTLLQPMNKCRSTASAVVYNNQMIVSGGFDKEDDVLNSLEALENVDEVSPLSTWEYIPAELPQNLFGHQSVVFNDNLIVVGGGDNDLRFDNISEVSLVPPYTSKLLASMTKKTAAHGMECFDDKLVIVGGGNINTSTNVDNNVVMYDVSKNQCKVLAPLPYPADIMATVRWHDNVIVLGGVENDDEALNRVSIYNVKTQKSHMLPPMLYKRKDCTAVVLGSMIIVMGGLDENNHVLKSVESFNFSRYTWEELTSMHEARAFATSVAC